MTDIRWTPDEMARLHGQCFDTPRPWKPQEFRDLLSGPHVFSVSGAHGFLLGRVIADEAELLTIAVSPDARRKGFGRALLRDFETEASGRNAKTAFLEVSAENDAALALYQAFGYARTGLRRDYYRTPDQRKIDAYVLTKALIPVGIPPEART